MKTVVVRAAAFACCSSNVASRGANPICSAPWSALGMVSGMMRGSALISCVEQAGPDEHRSGHAEEEADTKVTGASCEAPDPR